MTRIALGGELQAEPVSVAGRRPHDRTSSDGLAGPDRRGGTGAAGVVRVPPAMLSAAGLVATDAFGLLRVHAAVRTAGTVEALRSAVAGMPALFVAMVQADVRAPIVLRVYTTLCDAVTSRLVDMSVEQRGAAPAPFAWLAFGSAGRGELTLFSDLDNGLAYADTGDPAVHEYFLRLATDVDRGLLQCGFALDAHGVLATDPDWRMQASDWVAVLAACLPGWDNDSVIRAAVGFDVRQVAGDLRVVPLLHAVVRESPAHSRFLMGMAQLGAEVPSPLGFRRRLKGSFDLKQKGLLPVQNLARYYACASGVACASTLERLEAVCEAGGRNGAVAASLRDVYLTMAGLLVRHQAEAFSAGRTEEGVLDVGGLTAGERARLEEALRVLASVQERLPRRASF